MIAVGRGATERVQEPMKGLGSNIMLVLPGGITAGGVRLGAQTGQMLTEEEAIAIAREIPEVQVAAPTLRTGAQVVAGNTNWASSVTGTTNEFLEARDWALADGRGFEAAEVQGSAKVALVGQTVAQQLFGDADPLDQVIRVKKVPVIVIGLLEKKGQRHGPGPGRGHRADQHLPQPHPGRHRRPAQARGLDRREGARGPEHEGGGGGPQGTAGPALQSAARRRRPVGDPQPHRSPAGAGGVEPRDDAAAGRRGGDQPRDRRHRHHEHHAGERHRAHARDRPAHGRRGARARHPAAVSDRGHDAQPDRRCHRRRARRHRDVGRQPVRRLAGQHDGRVDRPGGGLLGFRYPARRASKLLPIQALRYE